MRKKTPIQLVIERHVTVPAKGYDKYFWPRESKLAKELIKLYTQEFLLSISPREGYKTGSLAFYKTDAGKNYLSDQLFEYQKTKTPLVEVKKEVELSPEKIGEDVVIQKKPLTLKDFLQYGKKD